MPLPISHAQREKEKPRVCWGLSVPPLPPLPSGRSAFPLYQACLLRFHPLGRHDGGGQSVLPLPNLPSTGPRDQATVLGSLQAEVRRTTTSLWVEQLRSQCPGPTHRPRVSLQCEPGVSWPLRRGPQAGFQSHEVSLRQGGGGPPAEST